MKKKLFIFYFLFFTFFCIFNFGNNVNSFGGNITAVNISILQTTDRWQVFYGKESLSNLNVLNTSYNLSSLNLNLPNTYSYYLISDSPSLDGNYSLPSLAEVDSYFNLSGASSSTYIFDNESNFSIYVGNTLTTFLLPTLYLSGKNEDNSTNPYAFRSGIIKKGNNFVFVIPLSTATGLDGEIYNFMFALPTNLNGISYYVFTTLAPSQPTSQTSPTIYSLSLSWEYDGKTLFVKSLPETTILLYDELGALYSGSTNSNGIFSVSVPAGFKYYLTAKKSGYKQVDTILYIPSIKIIENITKEEIRQPIIEPTQEIPEGKIEVSGPQTVFIEAYGGGRGISLCFEGGDCYSTEFASKDEIEKLTELNCVSSICTLSGLSKSEFTNKYKLRRVEQKFFIPPKTSSENVILDYGSFFKNIGYELSKSLGTAKIFDARFPNFFLYLFVFFSVLAIFFYILFSRFINKEASKGYD